MEIAAVAPEQAGMRNVLNERVMERENLHAVVRRTLEQACGDELVDGFVQAELAADRLEQRHAHPPADHGRRAEHPRRSTRKQIDPRREDAFDRRRDVSLLPSRTHLPASIPNEQPGVAQPAEQLLDEERIALGA